MTERKDFDFIGDVEFLACYIVNKGNEMGAEHREAIKAVLRLKEWAVRQEYAQFFDHRQQRWIAKRPPQTEESDGELNLNEPEHLGLEEIFSPVNEVFAELKRERVAKNIVKALNKEGLDADWMEISDLIQKRQREAKSAQKPEEEETTVCDDKEPAAVNPLWDMLNTGTLEWKDKQGFCYSCGSHIAGIDPDGNIERALSSRMMEGKTKCPVCQNWQWLYGCEGVKP
jgi:hypothetical protein